jgi:hypothetical protein
MWPCDRRHGLRRPCKVSGPPQKQKFECGIFPAGTQMLAVDATAPANAVSTILGGGGVWARAGLVTGTIALV